MEGRKESVGLHDREDDVISFVESEDESCSLLDEDEEGSENSNFCSSFSSELTEDASSSSTSSSFSGPLFEFSDLMANLPIKRGLSRYYDGKSQSFTCLGRATSLEDLVKKDHSPYKKRMKTCMSYAANIGSDPRHRHRITGRSYSPKATIAKKGFRINSLLPSPPTGKRVTSTGNTTVGR